MILIIVPPHIQKARTLAYAMTIIIVRRFLAIVDFLISKFLNCEFLSSLIFSEFVRAEFTTEKNARVSDSNTLEEVATTVYLQKTDVSKLGE